jgi:hypothetical protein
MNRAVWFRGVVVLVSLLITAVFLLAQKGLPAKRALVVNGYSVPDAVMQINGHAYVEIAALAEATNATVKFLPDRVVLTMHEEGSQPQPQPAAAPKPAATPQPPAAAPQPPAAAQPKDEITKEFARTALADLALMREWQDAIIGMIKAGEPANARLKGYHERAAESLRLASVAATSSSDHNALQLLRNEFASMRQWSVGALAANKEMKGEQAVSPDFPQNDAVITKISECHSFLNSMIVSGVFTDSALCH